MKRTQQLGMAVVAAFLLLGTWGCMSGVDGGQIRVPAKPAGLGRVDTAPAPGDVPAYVDTGASNQRGKASQATLATNAGVRVLAGMLGIWAPRAAADGKVYVDAGVTAPAEGSFPEVKGSDWSGIPGDTTDGRVLDKAIHEANIAYVVSLTAMRTPAQEAAAYLDDRRGKSVSIADGLGSLMAPWLEGTRQTTTITGVPADATTVKYDDKGINRGVTSAKGNTDLGKAVDLVFAASVDASTEPAKRYYKYARPWRWTTDVVVAPSLEPAKSTTPPTDGGFPSGHTAEAWRDALTIAWLVPQRYQEMLTRAAVMGENRMLAGMHSPLDVMGGRIMAMAQVAYNLSTAENQTLAAEAYTQTQAWLAARTGTSGFDGLLALARAGKGDPYGDWATNLATFTRLAAPGFSPKAGSTPVARIPKGAEVLLVTRFPYLSGDQRRVLLKTTAFPAGYPLMDDAEGWGRLDLFSAADGYRSLDGDLDLVMDAAKGGYSARDLWRNPIAGKGRLSKSGTGTLVLAGDNSWTGGTILSAGGLEAVSARALGTGDVYVEGGTLTAGTTPLALGGAYTQTAGTLHLDQTSAGSPALRIPRTATLAGGTLEVIPPAGSAPGQTLTILEAATLRGTFESIRVAGFPGSEARYSPKVLTITLR